MGLLDRIRPDLAAKYPRPERPAPAPQPVDERALWVRLAEQHQLRAKELAR